MTLTPGTRLGHYEVVGPLGVGGMGEVYRARDMTIHRDAAIKVLPAAFASDSERLTRFQREAEALAALNHANIAQIYGVVESDGSRAIAMELVEGETLADRIARGPIPTDEALGLAQQIADALEAAHDRGIIHRDLKPANIKVRDDGVVKVLDFGLARVTTPEPAAAGNTMQATMTSPATQLGVILGTAAYMAPEQARGRPIDRRADMWAFGCVLFEMLTGRRAFEGEDITETIGKVLERQPDWSRLPAATPQPIQRLLRRCFEKNPRDRTPGAASARLEIKDALSAPDIDGRAAASSISPPWWRRPLPIGAALFALGATAALIGSWSLSSVPAIETRRFDLVLPAGTTYPFDMNGIAIDPAGTTVVFTAYAPEGPTRYLYRRGLNAVEAEKIPGTEGAYDPYFWPDGESVGFATRPAAFIKKVRLTGGAVEQVLEMKPDYGLWALGATFDQAGRLIFGTHTTGLMALTVGAGTGTPASLTSTDEGAPHRFPKQLPGGATLFTIGGTPAANKIGLRSPSGKWNVLLESGSTDARYVPTGHLVYWKDRNLWAVRFDFATLQPIGESRAVVTDVRVGSNGEASYAWSADGTLVYVPHGEPPARTLAWMTRDKKETPLRGTPGPYTRPELSKDLRHVLLTRVGFNTEDIYLHDIEREQDVAVSAEPYSEISALWWPGRDRIVFAARQSGPFALYSKAADGSGSLELLKGSQPTGQGGTADCWADTRHLVFESANGLWLYSLDDHTSKSLLSQPGVKFEYAQVSPDGHWFAYQSNEVGGQFEVFVRRLDHPDVSRSQISHDGGTQPRWSANGKELFYRKGNSLVSTAVRTDATPVEVGATTKLFDGVSESGYDYDAVHDRFLVIKEPVPSATDPVQRIIVIQHWFDELKRLVPSK